MQALPANPNLDWLRKAAKRQLSELRAAQPKPAASGPARRRQRYGFKSWRALKAHVDDINLGRERDHMFAAAHAAISKPCDAPSGRASILRRPTRTGAPCIRSPRSCVSRRSSYSCAMPCGATRPADEAEAVRGILRAAQSGDVAALRTHLDAHPALIDALGGDDFQRPPRCTLRCCAISTAPFAC